MISNRSLDSSNCANNSSAIFISGKARLGLYLTIAIVVGDGPKTSSRISSGVKPEINWSFGEAGV